MNSPLSQNCRAREMDNVLLSLASLRTKPMRESVPNEVKYAVRSERCAHGTLVSLWFKTEGCCYDDSGGCVMCDYGGARSHVSGDEMVDYVRSALGVVPRQPDLSLFVSPAGSMLDENEVPPFALEAILRAIKEVAPAVFFCETRCETITKSALQRLARNLSGPRIFVEMGLESSSELVLRYCLNKGLSRRTFVYAVRALKTCGIGTIANLLLGSPFLSCYEAIEDCAKSARWALSRGSDECVIFPVHVKRGTLVEWLWRRGMYSPPSLWSLVAVLNDLGPTLAPRVTISWHKTYKVKTNCGELDPLTDLGYLASPGTCPTCQGKVIGLLDTFRDTNDFAVVRELMRVHCPCREEWTAEADADRPGPLHDRIESSYCRIGKELLGWQWWQKYERRVLSMLAHV